MATLYTIGHSTRTLDELVAALQAHRIQTLADIRAYPGSRRLPQFNAVSLARSLPGAGIRYLGMKALGGYREKGLDDSPNLALSDPALRNYADYMLAPDFERAVTRLVATAGHSRTALMCAERVYLNCHRLLVSDWLLAHGHPVVHIDDAGPGMPHRLTAEARIQDGRLVYRGDRLL